MAILSKGCKPDNLKLYNSLKLSFMNTWAFVGILFIVSLYLNQTLLKDILVLCNTNLDNLIDSGNFSVRGYLPLIWRDSTTHMHGLAVFVKEELPFRLTSRKLCRFLLMFLTGFTSLGVLLLFPLLISFFVFTHGF